MIPTRVVGPVPRALAVVLCAFLLGGVLTLVASSPAAAARDDVTVEVTAMSPTVVGPGDTQEVTARITNGSGEELTGLRADLGVGWREVPSRESVAAWSQSTDRTATRQLSLPQDDLPAGESAEVTFELRVAGLQLGTDAPWGPRRMSVSVVDDAGTIDVLHSFMLYDPGAGTEGAGQAMPAPVGLSVVAPLTGPALDPAEPDAYNTEVAERTSSGGLYERLLSAAEDDGLSLAVDPAVVAAAADSSRPTPTDWAARLQSSGTADVVTLPPGDPDLAALAHAGLRPSDIEAATDPRALLPDDWSRPEAWDTTVAWPASTTDLETLSTAVAAGSQHVVVTDGITPTSPVTATTGTVATGAGEVPVVVSDTAITDALAAGTQEAAPTVTATQQLLADTAVLATDAAESGTATNLVAALPRGWAPDLESYTAVTKALAGQGWVDLLPVSDVLQPPSDIAPRHDVVERIVDDAELRPDAVRAVAESLDEVAAFSTVATDPHALSAPVSRDLVAPLSLAYRGNRESRDAALDLALTRADQVQSGVRVVGRGDVTLVSDEGDLPVRIRNDLSVDATVTVRLSPDDPRLIVETTPTVVVPAGQSRDAEVHVRAIGSGDVNLGVEVLAPSGAPVAPPTQFAVQVRAGWETVGTAVMAGAVGLLFVAGIWRTVRRGRSDRRTTAAEVSETAPHGTDTEDPEE